MRCSSPSIFISVPEYFPNRILSPTFTDSGDSLAAFEDLAVPYRDHPPFLGLFLGGVGDDNTPFVFSSSSILLTTSLSCNGLTFIVSHSFLDFW